MAEQQRYEFKKVPEEYFYDFFSEGPNGKVKKVARYRLIDEQNSIYNLGFGDWDEKNDDINDRVKTNNLDREKVLMTIADTIVDFTANHPKAAIFIQGSTLSRTRLYQMGIAAFWSNIVEIFNVIGYTQDQWEPFKKGINYEAFPVQRK